ncbi:hypothetical protein WJX81_006194 [Elliptochloris bilobata]|uniref:Menin n=1 Tax=Elliptochloris bilobata TaxID=381761 RepID=A0AAW1SHT4_9CHLO
MQEDVAAADIEFGAFLQALAPRLDALDARGKVKAVADAVWTRLSGNFSKDVLHAQHIYVFVQILRAGKASKARRQLDCAGVVTTVLAACQRLARVPAHEDLLGVRFQVSEDHCWLSLDGSGARTAAVEVTTDTAAKRGLAPSEDAWRGWLYSGGCAAVCSPQMCVTALVASLNPAINPRQNSGSDSEEVQCLQRRLLELARCHPCGAVYPAALCALADLQEVAEQDELDAHAAAGNAEQVLHMLELPGCKALFEVAIVQSLLPGQGAGRLWYPYSYCAAMLARRACFLAGQTSLLGADRALEEAERCLGAGMRWCGGSNGARVLRLYRRTATDEQLIRDVEGTLEAMASALSSLQAPGAVSPGGQVQFATSLLELWDGVCSYFSGQGKPAAWVSVLLKALRLVSPDARAAASAGAQVESKPMQRARGMWEALKPTNLRLLLESADVGDVARETKRPRR